METNSIHNMGRIMKHKVCSSLNTKYRDRWISPKDLGLDVKQSCRRLISERNSVKMKISFQVQVPKHLMKDDFCSSLKNQFSVNEQSEAALHISPPDSPSCLRNSSAKRLKSVGNGKRDKLEMSQTPIISQPLSPIKATSDFKIRTPLNPMNFSLPARKVNASRKHSIINAKRELLQEFTITASHSQNVNSAEDLDIRISQCCSPRKSSIDTPSPISSTRSPRKIKDCVELSSPRLDVDTDISPSVTPIKTKPNKNLLCRPVHQIDIIEQPSSARKENTGSTWLSGITWQPKTPEKTDCKPSLPESSKKKRYHVSGGFAQRLKQLELREQSSLNLQRHIGSSKGDTYASFCVKAVNFSSPAFPLACCQNTSNSEEVLFRIPRSQIPNVAIGSILRAPHCYLETPGSSFKVIHVPDNLEIVMPQEVYSCTSDSPNIVFKWQCPCRNDPSVSNSKCPANLTVFH